MNDCGIAGLRDVIYNTSFTSFASVGQFINSSGPVHVNDQPFSYTSDINSAYIHVTTIPNYTIIHIYNDVTNDSIVGTLSFGTNQYPSSEYLCVGGGAGTTTDLRASNGGSVYAGRTTITGTYTITIAGRSVRNQQGNESDISGNNLQITALGGQWHTIGVLGGNNGGLNGQNYGVSTNRNGANGVSIESVANIISDNIYPYWGGGGGYGTTTDSYGNGGNGGGGGCRNSNATATGAQGFYFLNKTSILNSLQGGIGSGGGAGYNGASVTPAGGGSVIFAIKTNE